YRPGAGGRVGRALSADASRRDTGGRRGRTGRSPVRSVGGVQDRFSSSSPTVISVITEIQRQKRGTAQGERSSGGTALVGPMTASATAASAGSSNNTSVGGTCGSGSGLTGPRRNCW